MTLPPALDPERLDRLAGRALASVPPPTTAPGKPQPSSRSVRRLGKRALRKAVNSPSGRRAIDLTRRVGRRWLAPELEEASEMVSDLTALRPALASVAHSSVDTAVLSSRLDAVNTNLELLKAEVRALERTLHELGMAFAPATGIAGVAARFGELREQVNAVSRRLRQLDPSTGGSAAASEPRPGADREPGGHPEGEQARGGLSTLFDYVAFERRFRGDPEDILATQVERYADLLLDHAPVVDLGCGRGELAGVLVQRGVQVIGVEPDRGMAAEAVARGVDVKVTDAATYLRGCAPNSLGAVFSAHVAEHMPFEDLLEIIHLSLDRLKPGGVFVAETPNPASLIVPSNSFILDPTHQRPVHPSLFTFSCETAGFRDVRLEYYSPATGYALDKAPQRADSAVARVVDQHADRLNHVLFGPQEYAVIATKAAAT